MNAPNIIKKSWGAISLHENISLSLKIATNFPNIDKWIVNEEKDNKFLNKFWKDPIVIDAQKTCLRKYYTRQYMEYNHKEVSIGIEAYPLITCPMCNQPT